jgi:hypothetical protein
MMPALSYRLNEQWSALGKWHELAAWETSFQAPSTAG